MKLKEHSWCAKSYHHHSEIQRRAGERIIGLLDIDPSAHALDIGCGDGKHSIALANRLRNGRVVAIDASKEMVAFAREMWPASRYPHLLFEHCDARHIDYQEEFDIIFSCFCFQWIKSKRKLFYALYRALKREAQLAFSIPLDISTALQCALDETVSSDRWATYLLDFIPTWHFETRESLIRHLADTGFSIQIGEQITQRMEFKTPGDLKHYVATWLPHLAYLPKHLKDSFLNDLLTRYSKNAESTILAFDRFDCLAQKK